MNGRHDLRAYESDLRQIGRKNGAEWAVPCYVVMLIMNRLSTVLGRSVTQITLLTGVAGNAIDEDGFLHVLVGDRSGKNLLRWRIGLDERILLPVIIEKGLTVSVA